PYRTDIYTLSLHDALPISDHTSSRSVDSRVAALVAASAGSCRSGRFRTTRDGRMAADEQCAQNGISQLGLRPRAAACYHPGVSRSEEHTSELQSRSDLVCR